MAIMEPEAEQRVGMIGSPAVVLDDGLRIPASVHSIARFREWAHSAAFPERGRIDYLGGDVEVDLSPEDLFTHGAVKTAVAGVLFQLVVETELGNLYIDRTRVTSAEAGLSVEPDIVVVLWESVELGRARHVPAAGKGPARFIEIEGAPDLVVEVVSDSSVVKDTRRLPERYARAGVREYWRIDARGDALVFEIQIQGESGFTCQVTDEEGWQPSGVLGCSFRLTRFPGRHSSWRYQLEHRAPAC
jgi:Uma2 family endonuclease